MIKRAIGAIVILGVIIVVVISMLHRKNFQSMLQRDQVLEQTSGTVPAGAVPIVETDTMNGHVTDTVVLIDPAPKRP